MNRLVIIGNGFDLAHGLPTGYCDFINDFWGNIQNSDYEDDFIKFDVNRRIAFAQAYSFPDIKNVIQSNLNQSLYNNSEGVFYSALERGSGDPFRYNQYVISFKNSFFGIICSKQSIQNWVDIENEYYQLLKKCIDEDNNHKVKKLNEEFEQVKDLFENYLETTVNQGFHFNIVNDAVDRVIDFFKIKPQYLKNIDPKYNDFLNEFGNKDHDDLIAFDNQVVDAEKQGLLADALKAGKITQRNLFLNFNYTSTIGKYIDLLKGRNYFGESVEIQIHGKLKSKTNRINFGFGDEMDEDYRLLEKKDDNEYLKNIKSFQYLQNSNYKETLDFIESENFQVYIMGHSCGLSDRILLNTIFEHNNCRSIKVFYYERGGWDNYTEIIQNISRHFNKKRLMREKIVNKSLCKPLPQDVRFAKKDNSPRS